MSDENTPVTRADLLAAISGLDARLDEKNTDLRSEAHRLHDAAMERLASIETKLLQAFYSYAESNQKRVSAVDAESAPLKCRLATLENRIFEIEKRLNMPPAA
jgi:hypothetical protein